MLRRYKGELRDPSPSMLKALEMARENGGILTMVRRGEWAKDESGQFVGTGSVQGLVYRGLAEFTKHRMFERGTNRDYLPYEMKLKDQKK